MFAYEEVLYKCNIKHSFHTRKVYARILLYVIPYDMRIFNATEAGCSESFLEQPVLGISWNASQKRSAKEKRRKQWFVSPKSSLMHFLYSSKLQLFHISKKFGIVFILNCTAIRKYLCKCFERNRQAVSIFSLKNLCMQCISIYV
jgi:hypothetical protein